MRKKTLRTRIMCSILALAFLVSLFQAPIPAAEAANTATIPVTIGNQTYQVTPGQNVTVNTPGGTTTYNVRFVDGKPVALDMTQVSSIIFGDAGSGAAVTSSSSSSSSSTSTTSVNTGTSKPATQTSGATAQQSTQTTQTTSTASSNSGKMTWNEFQKANAGKGMSGSEMSQAWKDYKAGNTTAQTSTPATQTSGSTAQQSTNTTQTSGATAQQSASAPAPQASVAEGASTTITNSSSSSTTSSNSNSQTSTTKAWDPAKHPRDPQTGRFISHEEAIARGLMDPADATTTSSSSSQSSQTTQTTESTQTTQTSGTEATQTTGSESGASAQAAQTTEQAAAPASGEKTKTSIGDKFKSGYQTGKNLTNQGFQNVKDSLKSGFSAKNLLVTAGITVGVDLATQIMRGEQPSLQKAIKTVCCAEFVGGVAGSVLGSAAGSFFVPFLSCVPVVGGALSALAPAFGSVVGSSVGAYMAGDIKNGRFSIKEAFKRVDWVGVTGQAIGSTVGAALGSCLGPVGTVLGGMVGGYFGNWAAHKIAGLFGKGEADLPKLSMPTTTGSMGYGPSVNTSNGITLGGDDVTSVTISDATPVTREVEEDPVVAAAEENDINTAYLEYTEYFNEYSELIQAGKTNEALEVAQKMNAAKAKYDSLRAASNEE